MVVGYRVEVDGVVGGVTFFNHLRVHVRVGFDDGVRARVVCLRRWEDEL